MDIISSANIWSIVRNTLSRVDKRLIQHGEHVAYIAMKIMQYKGGYSSEDLRNRLLICLLHDIGAYKTDEIDRMVQFESEKVWQHSVYGYLFVSMFSPVSKKAGAILYHHLEYKRLKSLDIDDEIKDFASLVTLSDRIDILMQTGLDVEKTLTKYSGTYFSPELVKDFLQADKMYGILSSVKSGEFISELEAEFAKTEFSADEKRRILGLTSYSIDFRSNFMLLHTISTVTISCEIGDLMGLDELTTEQLFYGALLHDIGKISTPVEILEKPGPLTPEERIVIEKHVVFSDEILQDVNPTVRHIAVRHHEKLDGSGYPRGLTAKDLSLPERICAVADILSALLLRRSYKDPFPKDKTIGILQSMSEKNNLCPEVVGVVVENFDRITIVQQEHANRMLEVFSRMNKCYIKMLNQTENGEVPLPECPESDVPVL